MFQVFYHQRSVYLRSITGIMYVLGYFKYFRSMANYIITRKRATEAPLELVSTTTDQLIRNSNRVWFPWSKVSFILYIFEGTEEKKHAVLYNSFGVVLVL